MKRLIIPTLALISLPAAAFAQAVTSAPANGSNGAPDYANAKPLPLPTLSSVLPESATAPADAPSGPPVVSRGAVGDGTLSVVRIAPAQPLGSSTGAGDVSSQQFGTFNRPFTTSRVTYIPRPTVPVQQPTEFSYPYRAAGKLFFNDGSGSFICSASLIKRGLVLTAAHCVSRWGQSRFYTNIRYVPAFRSGLAPFGTWTGTATVLTSYFVGTAANCTVAGVVCNNDIAVIRLTPQAGAFPGTATGWLGYGANGWGFTTTTPNKTLINQLGYPGALDNAQIMQRNDSQGERSPTNSDNTLIGSLMTGGSSGGPWVNNLGVLPALNGTGFGTFPSANIVVGVTSWGYISTLPKEQGASRFTSANIITLVNAACGNPVSQPACL